MQMTKKKRDLTYFASFTSSKRDASPDISKKKTKSIFGLAFTSLLIEHGNVKYDEIEFDSSVEEEPPTWHEAVLELRYQAWMEGKKKVNL